jgi:hypothetical protein
MSMILINSILSKKYGTTITLPNATLVPHPSDIIRLEQHIKIHGNATTFVSFYEPFEIRSDDKVYSHIIADTVDVSHENVLQFETDMDLNSTISVLGSPRGSKIRKYNGVSGHFRRKVIVDYKSIWAVEYITFKEV